VLDPAQYFAGQPDMAFTQTSDGLWLVDLSSALNGGRLRPGESTIAQTVTLRTPGGSRADVGHGIFAVPCPNTPPVIDSAPVTTATAGTPYSYQVLAHDPDGVGLTYLLLSAPDGMALDADTGVLTWSPTTESHAQTSVRDPSVLNRRRGRQSRAGRAGARDRVHPDRGTAVHSRALPNRSGR
jgi:putative Ig domain-containing protein